MKTSGDVGESCATTVIARAHPHATLRTSRSHLAVAGGSALDQSERVLLTRRREATSFASSASTSVCGGPAPDASIDVQHVDGWRAVRGSEAESQ